VAFTTFLVYDYVLTFGEEVRLQFEAKRISIILRTGRIHMETNNEHSALFSDVMLYPSYVLAKGKILILLVSDIFHPLV
jgi:hypothetical protein